MHQFARRVKCFRASLYGSRGSPILRLRMSGGSMLALTEEAEEPNRKPSLGDDAYGALKEAIRENMFPPGYQGSEQEIATRLGMSRTPVHEAVIRLQEEGLVRVLPRRGVVVCVLSAADIRE